VRRLQVLPPGLAERPSRALWRTALSFALGALAASGAAQADVDYATLAVHQGETVAAIELAGNAHTRPHVIRREIHCAVGAPLLLETIRDDVQRLENLQVFADIRVVAEDVAPGRVRLTYAFKEMPTWLPTLAFTYTEENGVSLGPGLVSYNLTGRDIDLSGKSFFGGTTQFSIVGKWPWIGGDHVGLALRAAHLVRDDKLDGFEENSDEVTPRLSRYLGRSGRLGGAFSFFRMRSDVSGKTLSPDDVDNLLRVSVALGWDTRDSWTNPRHGWQNELEVWKTGGILGGDGDFWTVILDVRRWQPTGHRRKVLLSGLATLQSGVVGEDIPEYLQYRLGGANTIRGYSIEDLGTRLYGKNQLIGTVEHAWTVVPPRLFRLSRLHLRLGVEVAAFFDAGTAWNEGRDLTLRRARAGGGVGLRLLTPVSEMIRVDFGWSPEGGFHVHFAGGSKPKRQRDRLR
jgi:outer membrane protein assembly factor BamA